MAPPLSKSLRETAQEFVAQQPTLLPLKVGKSFVKATHSLYEITDAELKIVMIFKGASHKMHTLDTSLSSAVLERFVWKIAEKSGFQNHFVYTQRATLNTKTDAYTGILQPYQRNVVHLKSLLEEKIIYARDERILQSSIIDMIAITYGYAMTDVHGKNAFFNKEFLLFDNARSFMNGNLYESGFHKEGRMAVHPSFRSYFIGLPEMLIELTSQDKEQLKRLIDQLETSFGILEQYLYRKDKKKDVCTLDVLIFDAPKVLKAYAERLTWIKTAYKKITGVENAKLIDFTLMCHPYYKVLFTAGLKAVFAEKPSLTRAKTLYEATCLTNRNKKGGGGFGHAQLFIEKHIVDGDSLITPDDILNAQTFEELIQLVAKPSETKNSSNAAVWKDYLDKWTAASVVDMKS